MMRAIASATLLGVASAAVPADEVKVMPGFGAFPFKVYSGYLNVAGPLGGAHAYDSVTIHYELHTSQGSPSTDPLVTWHQGGPGGSSMYGAYTEMGYFQVDSRGNTTNPYAWNRVANMLYLESPAGCDDPIGFSYCTKGGKIQKTCQWDDKTQAEAYAHTLAAFLEAFPEYKSNDLYLTGESYAGQYVPNIAHFIVNNEPFKSRLNLKGLALGNACWGGTATEVNCNGPNSEQNDLDMYHGKGLVSKKAYDAAYAACKFPDTKGMKCELALMKADQEVGPHNIYDIYDNCPATEQWLAITGKSMRWLRKTVRDRMSTHGPAAGTVLDAELKQMSGGYDWGCNGMGDMASFFKRKDVQTALHLTKGPQPSEFGYDSSGPASITLWPELVKKLRVLIYNGDSDACVPYKGNEEWTTSLETKGIVTEKKPWHPWFTDEVQNMPAGYATTYNVTGAPYDFSFVTVRLAGHMVPTFQPASAYTFFSRFMAKTPF